MVDRLGSERFPVRHKAAADLAAVGARALPFLQEVLKSTDLDVKRYATSLIDARMNKQERYSVSQWLSGLNNKNGGDDFSGQAAYTKVPEVLHKDLSPKHSADKQAELSALASIWKDVNYNGAHSKTPDLDKTFEQQISDHKFPQAAREMVKTLNLRNTDAADKELAQLKALPNLTSLNLAGLSITDKGLSHLSELTTLKRLGLAATNVTDAGLSKLADNKKIEKLDLGNTDIIDKGLAKLATLPALKELNLFAVRGH